MTLQEAATRLRAIRQQVASMQPAEITAASAGLEELAIAAHRLSEGDPRELAAPLNMLRRSLCLARRMYGAQVEASVRDQGGYTPVGEEMKVGPGQLELRG